MPRRRGLLSTAARTAVIAGTATSVSGRVARRQQQKFAAQAAQPAHPAHAPAPAITNASLHPVNDIVESLRQLAELKASGALSEKEYASAKAKVLAS